jgi:hypothetical protein
MFMISAGLGHIQSIYAVMANAFHGVPDRMVFP